MGRFGLNRKHSETPIQLDEEELQEMRNTAKVTKDGIYGESDKGWYYRNDRASVFHQLLLPKVLYGL